MSGNQAQAIFSLQSVSHVNVDRNLTVADDTGVEPLVVGVDRLDDVGVRVSASRALHSYNQAGRAANTILI